MGENKKVIDSIQQAYGWHFLAKEVADYTNCSFFEIMERSAMEVFSIVMLIQAKVEVEKLRGTSQKTIL